MHAPTQTGTSQTPTDQPAPVLFSPGPPALGVAGQMFTFPGQEVWLTDWEDSTIPSSPSVQTSAGEEPELW